MVPDAGASVDAATVTSVTVTGAVDPYAEVPALDAMTGILLPERIVGFSKDDRYLGYELSTCDPCPSEFHFRAASGPGIDLSYFYDPTLDEDVAEKRRKRQDAEVDAKLLALGAEKASAGKKLRGLFPYPDLVFAAKDTRDAAKRVTLLVGAHLPGKEPVFPMRIELGPHPMRTHVKSTDAQFAHLPPAEREAAVAEVLEGFDLHEAQLAYINVTKNGREIGAVAEASGTMWFEVGGVARMPTASFVAQVYNDTGMRELAKDENAVAADLFAKAEAARPEAAIHAYNLACATARLHDAARAAPALERAIARSPSFRDQARRDHDFDGVRGEPWFVALVK